MKKLVASVAAVAACWVLTACEVTVQDLGGSRSEVTDVNQFSTVVGSSWLPSSTPAIPIRNAFMRSFDGEVTHLRPLAGQDYSHPYAINDDDVAVGESGVYVANHAAVDSTRAVRWGEDGQASDLGTLAGGTTAGAWDINAHGVIVGWSSGPGGRRGFVLDPTVGAMTELPLPAGATSAVATAINDAGIAVGWATYPVTTFPPSGIYGDRAVRWDVAAGTVTMLPSDRPARAFDINGPGAVVGSQTFQGFQTVTVPALWTATGEVQHHEGPPGAEIPPTGNVTISARKVNDAGLVIVSGYFNYSWSPEAGAVVPEAGRTFGAVNDSGVIGGTRDDRAVLIFPDL
jgi:uncharacterized membrane protein